MIFGLNSKNLWKMVLACFVYGLLGLVTAIALTKKESNNRNEISIIEADDKEEFSILAKDKELQITKWVHDAPMYDLYKLEGTNDNVTVWIDMKNKALNEVEGFTNGLTTRIVKLFDYDIKVNVTSIQTIENSSEVRAFGTSLFLPARGKVEFMPTSARQLSKNS